MTSKQLDLLKKFTRLANNNPNDHEANNAARRVCKILEECSFNLTVNNTEQSRPNFRTVSNPQSASYDWFSEMFRGYNEQRSRANQQYYEREYRGTWDNIHRTTEPEFKSKPPPNVNYQPYTYGPEQSKPVKEVRKLKCIECKKESETKFVGHPDVYVCNKCQWTAYTKEKVK